MMRIDGLSSNKKPPMEMVDENGTEPICKPIVDKVAFPLVLAKKYHE